ncbi:hypothetical protein KQX54_008857 [Cotesia glomerata]|uniref:Uncharacterized protein n=1 Tax=Cotesia glomerata TaxID=32391 RepID=A0AAV7HTU1_COTGL|nr:hypothetical protein KQX54_008857 [Cotesia glomerata]
MFSLIFWIGLGYASVVKTEKIKTSTKSGFVVKSRNKNLPIKILLQDDDEEYLNKQTVDEAGNILKKAVQPGVEAKNVGKKGRSKKDKEPNPIDAKIVDQQSIFCTGNKDDLTDDQLGPTPLTTQKAVLTDGQLQTVAHGSKRLDRKDKNQSNERLSDGRPTGDRDILNKIKSSSKAETRSTMESIHSDNEEQTGSQGSKHHQDQEQIEDYSSDTESSEKKCNKRKGTGADKKVESSQRSHKPKKLRREKSSSSDDSSDTSGNLSGKKLFEEFLKWHEKKKSKSRSRSESKSRSNKHRKDKKPKAKEVELVEKSGIIVNRFKLDLITESNTKNPREMTRQLFKLIVGTEELAKMTIVKTKGRELMPEKYLEAIFGKLTYNDVAEFFYVCTRIYKE